MRRTIAGLLVAASLATSAGAQAPPRDGADPGEPRPRHFGNFRLGASTVTENGRPDMCLELFPVEWLSVEGCGTGSGFLHKDPGPQLAHFAAKVRVATRAAGSIFVEPHVAVGFAELSVGEDAPGFRFGGTGSEGIETAGPEVGAGVRMLIPMGEFEGIVDLRLSCAYLPHAPRLVSSYPAVLPSAGVSVGFGF